MSASDLATWRIDIRVGTLSARLERFDVTAPLMFVLAGVLLTHGPLAPLGFAPCHEPVKSLAELTLVSGWPCWWVAPSRLRTLPLARG
jgi:hypothetical protein